MTDHRFIEESLPVKQISAESADEKNLRHGTISTLHTWWARRPLAASRATAYAALIPAPSNMEEWQGRRDFISELCRWESLKNGRLLQRAQSDILRSNGGQPPRVLDPFAGGGSYPLESMRLGCETYASDYNPVAVLILKATTEYPQRFGEPIQVQAEASVGQLPMAETYTVSRLLQAVQQWTTWIYEQVHHELKAFYPPDASGKIPVGYIWARTIPCQNPSCNTQIPLLRQFWLAKKDKKRVAMYPDTSKGDLFFRIVGDGYSAWPSNFDPDQGTVSRAVATCPVCGTVVDDKTTRRLFQEGASGHRMIVVILQEPNRQGKLYRLAGPADIETFNRAAATLQEKRELLALQWGLDPVPDEPIPLMSGTFNVPLYGMHTWGSLFNARQQLAMIVFADQVRQAHVKMLAEGVDPSFAVAVATYLAFGVDELARFTSTLNPWKVDAEAIVHAFGRQALPMLWDYDENNPLGTHGGTWINRTSEMLAVLSNLTSSRSSIPTISQASATELPYHEGFFDAVLTDPPYYNSVPYADLSDFFYVWLKRTVGNLYPDLFATPLSPKEKEITEMAGWDPQRYGYKDKEFFESHLQAAFSEIRRVLKPDGIAVIVYTHKSTAGWETVVNALLDSGLVISGAWPLDTEMRSRLRAQESAALASSIYIVARKTVRQPAGFYNEVRDELRHHLNAKLQRLWEEGIGGADFFIAAIGSAIEVFGKYEQILDYEGALVRADRLLQDVRTVATDYAVHQILHNGFAGEISDLTRFYVLWRWEFGEARVPFDEARKLAQSCGLDISREWGRGGFVKKDKDFIQVLGPQARKLEEGHETSHEMIDVLHRVLLLWERGLRMEMLSVLAASGYGTSEAFYRVAQAISETLPNESKEKKLLDGFLAGRGRVRDEVEQIVNRPTLWQV